MAAGTHRRSGKEHIIRDNLKRYNNGYTNENYKRLAHRDLRGGGNFITQSAPTNFHQFYTRKILTATESIDDFLEVTAAEKSNLEAADAKWIAPSEELIAEYNLAMTKYGDANSLVKPLAFGHYDAESGYFIYGNVPLSTAEAQLMLAYRKPALESGERAYTSLWQLPAIAPVVQTGLLPMSFTSCFSMCRSLKVVALQGYSGRCNISDANSMFATCTHLTTILGDLYLEYCASVTDMFGLCSSLSEVRLLNLKVSISLAFSPNISLGSISCMVANANNRTTPITITLHPDAYARVTDELFALAAEKNITIAST